MCGIILDCIAITEFGLVRYHSNAVAPINDYLASMKDAVTSKNSILLAALVVAPESHSKCNEVVLARTSLVIDPDVLNEYSIFFRFDGPRIA
jgi:hypothetical protein